MEMNPLVSVYNDFMTIIKGCVIKYNDKAEAEETMDIKRKADGYIAARHGEDIFLSYYDYDYDILSTVMGIPMENESELEKYHNDRRLIPDKYRDALLEKKRHRVIDTYEEKNNYYRMLAGLPNKEETKDDWIYLSESLYELYDIPKDTPIHKLDISIISSLQGSGYLDEVISAHPNKEYLKYLGANAIDLTVSRTTKNFGLLYIPSNISNTMKENFTLMYDQCREYFMTCIYIREYKSIYDYYDNFIALCIMLMTMQQTMARVSKVTIEREFFDSYCIQLLYDTYDIPYYDKLDEVTQKSIMQNLNILVQNKGTNKVLFDIMSILGYDRMNIYKYYLMKERKFDAQGLPISVLKTVTTEDGETKQVPDYEAMYDVYFQRVLLDEDDLHQALVDNTNKVSYAQITTDDPFWWEDDNLYKELYESEYNYVESKYLGVSISYRLSRIMYDNIFFIKMIFDKKDEITNIYIDIPKILEYGTCSLFDAVVTLCAMVCKQNNLKGEILTTPSKILHVIGFNFNKNFNLIREEIQSNPYIDDSVNKYLENMTAYTVESVNGLFENIRNLKEFIIDKMSSTDNIEVYHAYKDLYNALYITAENREMFKIGPHENNEYAETYMDYLRIYNTDLYDFIENTDAEDLYVYANHIISKLSGIVPKLKYLGLSIDSSATLEYALIQLIKFFKSYTTDMIGMNIVYVYDIKPESMIRLIDKGLIHKTIMPREDFNLSYSDVLMYVARLSKNDNIRFWDRIKLSVLINFNEYIKFNDKSFINARISWNDPVKLIDKSNHMIKTIETTDLTLFQKDTWNLISTIRGKSDLQLTDKSNLISKGICNNDNIGLVDNKESILVKAKISSGLKMNDTASISYI